MKSTNKIIQKQVKHLFFAAFVLVMGTSLSCYAGPDEPLTFNHLGNNHCLVQTNQAQKYLLLPVEEKAPEVRINILVNNKVDQTINVHLAVHKVDYFVPFELASYAGKVVAFSILQVPDNAVCWNEMKLSNEFDMTNRENYRPVYHFSPAYGWMNDPNGMVYKDGEYHLFFQYNPYGSMWGNMNWGHAVSKDMIHWKQLPVAISPDGLGTIFSGSCVVDKNNTAGFGVDAIVAMYTSAGEHQTQSLAYSTDNGRTFTKYNHNPVITSSLPDFRDPNLFWNEEIGKWNLILAAGEEMRIYSSPDLKDWTQESSFGKGEGAHGSVWECPDLMQLPVKGTNKKKWVLVCNLNVGPSGGSATQYFVGSFNGKIFTNESTPEVIKWMDWGKDHYATVSWDNVPESRHIVLAWMSNLGYANDVPTQQYRSSHSIPRELSLYELNGETYLSCTPIKELETLRGIISKKGSFLVNEKQTVKNLLKANKGAYEIVMDIKSGSANEMGFTLSNAKGEKVDFVYNLAEKTFSMDRTKSGKIDFNKNFAAVTKAPIENQSVYRVRLLIDKSSIEAFDGEGHFAMTNLIFPSEPYNQITYYSKNGKYTIKYLNIYPLDK